MRGGDYLRLRGLGVGRHHALFSSVRGRHHGARGKHQGRRGEAIQEALRLRVCKLVMRAGFAR